MSPIAGQTIGLIGLKFFCEHSRVAAGVLGKKKFDLKNLKKIVIQNCFFSRATPGPPASL